MQSLSQKLFKHRFLLFLCKFGDFSSEFISTVSFGFIATQLLLDEMKAIARNTNGVTILFALRREFADDSMQFAAALESPMRFGLTLMIDNEAGGGRW